MKKILFITTYKARDFEGNSLIGYILLKKYNIETVYVSGYDLLKKIIEFKPIAIIFDHLVWKHKIQLLKVCQNLGLKTFFYPTEGYYLKMESFDESIGLKNLEDPEMNKYLLWGSDMLNRAKSIEKLNNSIDLFKITGASRFDFYLNSKLLKLVESKDEFCYRNDISQNQLIITIMSTHPYQGYQYKDFHKRYKKAGYSDEIIKADFYDQQKLFEIQTSLALSIAREYSNDVKILYKAHPAETYLDSYSNIFRDFDNIKLVYNENVKPYLMHSDIIIQHNCTTAIEAWLLNKKVLQLDFETFKDLTYLEHFNNSIICKNSNDVLNAINKDIVESSSNKQLKLDFLERKFFKLDGHSHSRIAFEISETIYPMSDIELNLIVKNINDLNEKIYNSFPNRLKRTLFIANDKHLNPRFFIKKMTSRFFNKSKNKNILNEVDIKLEEVKLIYSKFESVGLE